MKITTTWTNDSQATIWNRLRLGLGRPPTHWEASHAVKRILAGEALDKVIESLVHPNTCSDGMGGIYRPGVILTVD